MRTFCFISQRGCPNVVPGREPRYGYREYPICNCVHSYSISPCQTPFFKNMSFATITERWTVTELVTVCTQGTVVHFCARVQVVDLVLWHRHRARILTRVCLKKEYVYILVPSEYRTWAPCPGTKCEGCFTFPRATKERGHICTHAVNSFDVEFRF